MDPEVAPKFWPLILREWGLPGGGGSTNNNQRHSVTTDCANVDAITSRRAPSPSCRHCAHTSLYRREGSGFSPQCQRM